MIAPQREQLQQYISELNDPRITYIHNDLTAPVQYAIRRLYWPKASLLPGSTMMTNGHQTRLSTFLADKQQLVTHAFFYANDHVCQKEVYSQPASLPLYPKSPYSRRLFYNRNIIGNRVFSWAAAF